MRLLLLSIIGCLALASCQQEKKELSTGSWRGEIQLQGKQLPFNFEIFKVGDQYRAHLLNGEEKILLDEITIFGDSVRIPMHIFDTELRARVEDKKLTGVYIKNYEQDYRLPFTAEYGDIFRFDVEGESQVNFTGKYAVNFVHEETDTTVSVGIFNQKGNKVTGTFLTPVGDYRYLQGNVVNNQLMLSTFDGNHAFLFTAIKSGDTLRGDYYSGKTWHETWVGIKDENAQPPDSETLTYLKPGFEKLDFSFPDLNGNVISNTDERFKNKVVILQIFGTWCPNCMDETKFLAQWYPENKDRGVEILGLAYERKDDFNYASVRVQKMKEKLGVDYAFVIAGTSNKEAASKTLPALNRILAFPTTIFVGKDGKVKYIHTGFEGPGTGVYYDRFKERFNEMVNECLNKPVI